MWYNTMLYNYRYSVIRRCLRRMKDKRAPKPRNKAGKAAHYAVKAADMTVDVMSSAVSAVLKIIGTVLLILIVSGLIFACIFAYYVKTCLTPTLDLSLEDYMLSESSTILYQDSGGSWQELLSLYSEENREWVSIDQIPDHMVKALISIEDKRFYEHKGVDWFRTSTAFIKMFATMQNTYGGSTITQQLIKNLTGNDEVTVTRKLIEIFSALELEKNYDKQEILEWYMNAVYFGEGCYGVQTAARTYFGKDVWELDLAEGAAIVGITNQPTAYDPYYDIQANKQRQENILREMYEQGYIDYQTYLDAKNEELVFQYGGGAQYEMPIYTYYEEVVIRDVISDLMTLKGISEEAARHLLFNGGYQIYCCLDKDIQSCVDTIYSNTANIPQPWRASSQQLQSAIVIMNPYDGRVVALCGGVGEKRANYIFNRASSDMVRPAGSSIKPIAVYGPAVESGLITPRTLVNDTDEIYLNGTSWYPSNDDGDYMGIIDITTALTYSRNTVSAQIVDKLTPQYCFNYLTTNLGVTSLVPEDADYAAMALGQMNYGITVREMCAAYCSFVNDGIFTKSRTYSLITDRNGNVIIDNSPQTVTAFSPNTAHVMTYMMQNAVSYGTGGEAYLGSMPVAGKTGTTSDSKDRWFVGCTPYYVAAVWTGYDTPEYIGISGNPAARLFRSVMSQVVEGLEYRTFTYPQIYGDTYAFGDLQSILDAEAEAEAQAQAEAEAQAAAEAAAQAAAEAGQAIGNLLFPFL